MKTLNVGRAYFMMFNCLDGGVVEAIDCDPKNLLQDRSIIVLDEENLRVWLWHGKQRLLVPRRTALRQAQSLKGHGYQAGNAIVGRGINEIIEIDDRKVGRVPEETSHSEELFKLLSKSFTNVGDFVYVQSGPGDTPAPAVPKKVEPKPVPKPQPKVEKPAPKKEAPVPLKKIEVPPKVSFPEAKPSAVKAKTDNSAEIKKGALIMAVLTKYKDLWISKKADGSITLEQMDGKICSYEVQNGDIKFKTGSFAEAGAEIKAEIEATYKKLIANL